MRPFTSPLNRVLGAKALVFGRSAMAWLPSALWGSLTLRLVIAVNEDDSIRWPALIFAAGCFTVGLVLNQRALIAWLVATPFVATCAFFGLLPIPESLVLGFCWLSLGTLARGRFFRPAGLPRHVLWFDGLATWIAVGFVWHWRELGDAIVARTLLNQPVFGFDDPLFLVTDTHLWLTAWILYRQWLTRGLLSDGNPPPTDGSRRPAEWPPSLPSPVGWMGIWIGAIGFAWFGQRHYQFPDLYNGYVSFSPFEDIHAFGSVIGALFVGVVCCISKNRLGWIVAIIAAGAIILVASSYSRATWLWVGIGVMVVIFLRYPRKVSIALAIIGVGLVGTLYKIAPELHALNHPYADRVAALVQVERWSQQDSNRLHYYRRSVGMIRDRPWFGYGTGSSRRITGDFIHNFLLQTATESGLPAMGFLLMGLAGAILSALRALRRTTASIETRALLAATLTYLGTQLTANAINIYPTQVFFFWPLVAMLYLSAKRDMNPEDRTIER